MLRTRLFVTLVVLWPAALTVLALGLVVDSDLFRGDPRRAAKVFVLAAMAGAVPLSFGVRDWWKIAMPEAEPELPRRYMYRTHLLYSLVIAMVAAGFALTSLIGPTPYRLFPSVVAVISFAGVRGLLDTARKSGSTTRDVSYSYDSRLPESAKDPKVKS